MTTYFDYGQFDDSKIEQIFYESNVEQNIIPCGIRPSECLKGLSYVLPGKSDRLLMKAGKFLKKHTLLNDDYIIKLTADKINVYLNHLKNNITVNINTDFELAYDGRIYYTQEQGNLACSCMRGRPLDVDHFYNMVGKHLRNKGLGNCQIAYEIDNNGFIHSRAIYWTINGMTYLDRIYSIHDQYLMPVNFDANYDFLLQGGNRLNTDQIIIETPFNTYDHVDCEECSLFVPYLDTFAYMLVDDSGKVYLSNRGIPARYTGKSLETLCECASQYGHVCNYRNNVCAECGASIDPDDCEYYEGDMYCYECAVYSDLHDRVILREDAIWLDDHNSYVHSDYVVETRDGAYIHEGDACETVDGSIVHWDDAIEFDGDYYHVDDTVETFDFREISPDEAVIINGNIFSRYDEGVLCLSDGTYTLSLSAIITVNN